MLTYRALFAQPEFRALWISTALSTVAGTMSSLALATVVHRQTGSALLTAIAMFGPSMAQMLGATTLMSAADASPPRGTLAVVGALTTSSLVLQTIPSLGTTTRLLVVLGAAYVISIGSGVRWGLLSEVVPPESFPLARSTMNVAVGAFQIVGFAGGGLLLSTFTAPQVFVLAALVSVVAVPVLLFGIAERPPRRAARAGLGETWRGNRRLLAERHTRTLVLALCVPNGLIVGCEALFVAYAPDRAGLLFACAAVGMLAGDTVVGRFVPERLRARLAAPLQLLLAAPYLLFALGTGLPPVAAAAAVAVSAVGYGASLLYQERLLARVPEESSGHALGLHGSGMLACQGLAAALAGGLAQLTSPATAMALLALASLAVTAALTAGLSSAAPRSPRTARRRTA